MTTDAPADAPEPLQRQLDLNTILTAYSQRLADATRDLVIAQAVAAAAEQECAQLRLQLLAAQGPDTA